MSTTIAIPARPDAVLETAEQGKSILAKLPSREWIDTVGFFAMAKLYLLRSRAPLVTNLIYWISLGLTLDDAKRIFRRLCDPDISQNHNFENQLMADMAALVNVALRRHRQTEDITKRRAAEAADKSARAIGVSLADRWAFDGRQQL